MIKEDKIRRAKYEDKHKHNIQVNSLLACWKLCDASDTLHFIPALDLGACCAPSIVPTSLCVSVMGGCISVLCALTFF